jgi:hypothetical protein
MNGKQRAMWYADLVSEGQRLQKKAHGHGDSVPLAVALTKLGEARLLALADTSEEGLSKAAWFYSAVYTKQWGMFALNVAYALMWVLTAYRWWGKLELKRERVS